MRFITLFLLLAILLPGVYAQDNNEGACTAPMQYGLSQRTLEGRRYNLYIPDSYNPESITPLVFSFHGFASNPAQQMEFSQWNAVADEYGFMVVYPRGTGIPARWNSGDLLRGENADDVAFVQTLIDTLSDEFCIDAARIYVNGLSNGAGMSYRLACELSDQIAAFGGVAGAYNYLPESCEVSRPVPVMIFHGTSDPIVPYAGGQAGGFNLPAIPDFVMQWAERNNCDMETESIPAQGDVSGIRYLNCNAEVIFYTIDEGGHTWPGGGSQSRFIVGKTSQDINASEVMWQFFIENPLP